MGSVELGGDDSRWSRSSDMVISMVAGARNTGSSWPSICARSSARPFGVTATSTLSLTRFRRSCLVHVKAGLSSKDGSVDTEVFPCWSFVTSYA